MKLETKHLAAYLPYQLKLYAGEYFVKKKLDVILDRLDVTTKAIDASNLDGVWFIDQVKPILRPLSQLTQEIEHNGEKFFPFKKLGWGNGTQVIPTILNGKINQNEYQKLLEWHFDIFGLIEKNLAIEKL